MPDDKVDTDAGPEKTSDTPVGGEGKGEGKLLAGKYKTPEELESAYTSLESKLGEQGTKVEGLVNEMGQTRKQNEYLLSQILSSRESASPGVKPPDTDTALQELVNGVESGDLPVGDALVKAVRIASDNTKTLIQEDVKRMLAEKDANAAYKDFVKEHPDFESLRNSGELEAIKKEQWMHDDFSAYIEYRRRREAADAEQRLNDAVEQTKSELSKVKEGEAETGTVSKGGGEGLRSEQKPKRPMTERESMDSMMTAINRVRGVT